MRLGNETQLGVLGLRAVILGKGLPGQLEEPGCALYSSEGLDAVSRIRSLNPGTSWLPCRLLVAVGTHMLTMNSTTEPQHQP